MDLVTPRLVDGISSPVSGRVNLLGVGINAVNMDSAVNACDELISCYGQGYVCVTGVHGLMEAHSDNEFRKILNRSFMSLPDGMPTVWVGHMLGQRAMRRVYGPDFMLEFCRHSVRPNYRHFLYGGNEGVADQLALNLRQRIPGLQIVGTYTPPFRPLTLDEERDLATQVKACRPDVIWVGLSTPKQERFMASHIGQLDAKLMVGVGAAFDVHTGRIKDSPNWVKAAGLQWFHRLLQEPRRLAGRYLVNNPKFMVRIILQLSGVHKYSMEN